MKLSVIIVNYKTSRLLLNCIESIYKFPVEGIEIIVVDNDSKDDAASMLNRYDPNIIYIQMGYNAGFARANNAGIKASHADLILLLNADTIIENNAINICADYLIDSAFIAAGVQLLNTDGTPQISGNFVMKGGLNYLLPLPFIGNFLKWIAGMFNVKKTHIPNASGVMEVDWINGAFLMVKRSAIALAGLLDEDFFLYAEETEWCSRLKKAGELCIYGDAHVIHLQGAAANEAFASSGKGYYNLYDRKGLQIMLSNFVRIRKEFGVAWFLVDLFFYCITIPVFIAGLLFCKLFFMKNNFNLFQWRQFCKNVFQLIRFTPHILRNKPFFYKVL